MLHRGVHLLRPLLACLGLWAAAVSHAGFGFQATDGAFIVMNYGAGNVEFRLTPSTGGEDPFDNHDFDTDSLVDDYYNYATNPLILSGFIARTFEDGGDDITGVNLFWRQYDVTDAPGLFQTVALTKVADLGGGDEEYQLLQAINLTTPPLGNLGGRIRLEVYVEAERSGGGTALLEGRDSSSPFKAYYTSIAIPEPASAGLILLGLFTLRHLHQRRLRAQKASANLQH